jgi:hypothetical protein
MDRALEARFTVGTSGATGIPHPIPQLQARTWPHQDATKAVHENAVWSFENDWQGDFVPQVVEAWMSSPLHEQNLLRASDTHWGLGYHIEPPSSGQTNHRFYVIAVFTEPLIPIPPKFVTLEAGTRRGRQVTANGLLIDTRIEEIEATEVVAFDAATFIPSQNRVHYHLTEGPLSNYWVKAGVSE